VAVGRQRVDLAAQAPQAEPRGHADVHVATSATLRREASATSATSSAA
jgi:hypothetical protein